MGDQGAMSPGRAKAGTRMMPRVYIVDDDAVLRKGLQRMLREAGHPTRTFASGITFLRAWPKLRPGCLILDLSMPGMDGFELLRELRAAGFRWPSIVLTGHANRRIMLRAMQGGSLEFLEKPVREAELFAAMLKAEAYLVGSMQERQDPFLAHILALLSMREREILQGVMAGELTKQTAARLDITESTVKVYRTRLKEKFGARDTSQLIQLTVLAGMPVRIRS